MEFRLLGPMQVVTDGRRAELGRRRERCLLGLLLLESGSVLATDRLIDLLWDGEPPDAAVGQLRTNVSRLRTHLRICDPEQAAVRIVTHGSTGYSVDVDPEHIDAYQFRQLVATERPGTEIERLRAALALWRGPVMADVMSDQLRYRIASGLDELRLTAMTRLAEARLLTGHAHELVADLSEMTERHPLREQLSALFMRCLFQTGSQAEASRAYHRLRTSMADQLGLEPSRELRDLHDRILRNDQSLLVTSINVKAAVRASPTTVPAQLPNDLPMFTGRTAELGYLDTLAARQERTDGSSDAAICVISGTAGVGKTAIAMRWSHRNRDRFPDGQIYLNLRGFDPTGPVMTTAAAMRRLLDAFGLSAQRIPSSLEAQTDLYRSAVADKRILVVLDNARDAAQVRPLLPGAPGCLTLVTSRHALTGLVAIDGARSLSVDLLAYDEARQLLAARLGDSRVDAEPGATDELVTRCARLPLALAVAAARATVDRRLRLSDLVIELRDARSALDALSDNDAASDVRAVFACSYHVLLPATARLFQLLGVHPGTEISAAAAASLAGVPLPIGRSMLGELVAAHLLEQRDSGWYTAHDLLRSYAASLCSDHVDQSEFRHASDRMFDHYLRSAYAGDRLVDPNRQDIALASSVPGVTTAQQTDVDDAMAWFSVEHPAMIELIRKAERSGLHTYTWQMVDTLQNFLDRRGHWHDLITVQEASARAARSLGERVWEATAHRHIALACVRVQRYDDANDHLDLAVDINRASGNLAGIGHVDLQRGWLLEAQQDYRQALRHTERALANYREARHQPGEARALNAIGWYHAELGNHRQTVVHCEQALRLFEQLADADGQAAAQDSLGYAKHHLGEHSDAVACYRQALENYRTLGDLRNEAGTLIHLGDAYEAVSRFDKAHANWERALVIFSDLEHPNGAIVQAKLARLATA